MGLELRHVTPVGLTKLDYMGQWIRGLRLQRGGAPGAQMGLHQQDQYLKSAFCKHLALHELGGSRYRVKQGSNCSHPSAAMLPAKV